MNASKRPYYAELEAVAGDETNHATVRDRHRLELDEPSWSDRGGDHAPCPVDYLLVGIAGCQLESLRHCLEKSRINDYRVAASIEGEYDVPVDRSEGIPEPTTNAISTIHLSIEVTTTPKHEGRVERCLEIAEDRGCIVSRTVEDGVDVQLTTSVIASSGDGE